MVLAKPRNAACFQTLCQWLTDLHVTYPTATTVVPLGVGGHRDHRITFHAACEVLGRATLLFFEDFPYVAYLPEKARELAELYNLVPLEIDITSYLEQRIHAVGFYKSQHAMHFYPPSSFQDMIGDYAQMGGRDQFVERYWKISQ